MKRKKAAGFLTAASGRNFLYQPEEGDSGHGGPADGGDADGDDEGDRADACGEHQDSTDAGEEDVKSTDEKADGILSFLKSTQEIYFYDGMFFTVLTNNGIHVCGKNTVTYLNA